MDLNLQNIMDSIPPRIIDYNQHSTTFEYCWQVRFNDAPIHKKKRHHQNELRSIDQTIYSYLDTKRTIKDQERTCDCQRSTWRQKVSEKKLNSVMYLTRLFLQILLLTRQNKHFPNKHLTYQCPPEIKTGTHNDDILTMDQKIECSHLWLKTKILLWLKIKYLNKKLNLVLLNSDSSFRAS